MWLSSLAVALLLHAPAASSQLVSPAASKPTIISPSHPVDSLGETVYESKDDEYGVQPVVPGVLIQPTVRKAVEPRFSRALKKQKFSGDITLLGVVSTNGSPIDFEAGPDQNQEAVACALKAANAFQFNSATLNGKAVAVRLKIIIHFQMF